MLGVVGSRVTHGKGYGYGAVTRTFHEGSHLVTIPAEKVTSVLAKAAVSNESGIRASSPNQRMDALLTTLVESGGIILPEETNLNLQASFGRTILAQTEPYAEESYIYALVAALSDLLPEAIVKGHDEHKSGIFVKGMRVPVGENRRYAAVVESPINTAILADFYDSVEPGSLISVDEIIARAGDLTEELSKVADFSEYAQGEVEGVLPCAEGLAFILPRSAVNGHFPEVPRQAIDLFFSELPVTLTLVHEEKQ